VIRAFLMMAVLTFGPRDPEHNGAPTAVDTSLMWLGALRDGHANMLTAFTTFPFTYREAWSRKRCTQTAANLDEFRQWVLCTHEKESRFIDQLRSAERDPRRLRLDQGLGSVSKRLRALAQGKTGRSTWINGSIKGDRVTYQFLFAISGNEARGVRVSSMFIDSSAEAK